VAVSADELETVREPTEKHAVMEDLYKYLADMGEIRDDATCLGDMVEPDAHFAHPRDVSSEPAEVLEPKTVRAYCEPLLPFLPVEDLEDPMAEYDDLVSPIEARPAARDPADGSDPIVEYLRESASFALPAEPTRMRRSDAEARAVPRVIPAENTEPEQAVVKTACVRPRYPVAQYGVVSSAVIPSFTKRRSPLWIAAALGVVIAALLLTSSVFTVEVLASKIAATRTSITEPAPPAPPPIPVVIPR
jgi:hypothetical protein